MILYRLQCGRGHQFEAWFGSASAYDRSSEAGENRCPECGDRDVGKAIMAPAVSGTKSDRPTVPAAPKAMKLAAADPKQQALRTALKELRKKVTENADYVGDRFAEEARKIHYEETEPRGIYGEATHEDAREMLDEGIEFHPLPDLPDDNN